MTPIALPHTNRVLGAPPFWDETIDGKCEGLPISDGDGFIASYWKATWRERLSILFGKPVRVCVHGYTTYPLTLDTQD